MKTRLFVICGCPRSGTTWLHNTLIHTRRFRGVEANDRLPASRALMVTDENRYMHALLMRCAYGESVGRPGLSSHYLRILRSLLALRFGVRGDLMLKSPYYCFFVDIMRELLLAQKFIYIRREMHGVALSMLGHGFLSRQITGNVNGFCSMKYRGINFETTHLPPEIADEFLDRYESLTSLDRAMFKSFCFASAFAETRRNIPREDLFIFDYESFETDKSQQQRFSEFMDLTAAQLKLVLSSFHGKAPKNRELPAHDASFTGKLRDAEAGLWAQ